MKIYFKDAAIFLPSTARTAPVVFFEIAKEGLEKLFSEK